MEFLNFVLQKFDVAFRKHEKEVVIEFAIDRILTFIGVHVLLALAGLFKVSEVVGETFNLFSDNIACYPYNTNSTPIRSFVTHANKFCWESTSGYSSHHINITGQGNNNLLDEALAVKTIYKILPYLFIAEATLLALPGVYWYITVGPRLSGLLKFMLHFLDDVYNTLKTIPVGFYRKRPYDKDSNYLDGWREFRPRYKAQHQGMSDRSKKYGKRPPVVLSWTDPGDVVKRLVNAVDGNFRHDEDSDSETKESKPAAKQKTIQSRGSWWSGFLAYGKAIRKGLYGDIVDRQIFSMLCYENFASLSYHPYILAVEALNATSSAVGHRRGIVPLKKGILEQLCHRENFKGSYLAKCYINRYALSLLLSSVLVLQSWVLFIKFFTPTFTTKVFPCLIPTRSVNILCVINKHWDVTALYLINTFMLTAHLILSIYQFTFVRFGAKRGMCYFFEDVSDSNSLALQSAARADAEMRRLKKR